LVEETERAKKELAMQAWMATYEEVKADAGEMAADEAARLESEALASLDDRVWMRELEGYELAERYGEV
jgi:hypothetical protein